MASTLHINIGGPENIQLSLHELPNMCHIDAYNMLVCQNCEKYCHPPFHSCLDSHMYCETCSLKRSVCIICRENIYQMKMPNLEKIHSVLKFPCNNWFHGCKVLTKGKRILAHQQNCPHTLIACPVRNCMTKNPANIIFDHLGTEHPNFVFPDIAHSKRIFITDLMSEGIVLKNIIKYCGMIFQVRIYVSFTGNFMRSIATNFGPYKGVEDYAAIVFFKQTNGEIWNLSIECHFSRNQNYTNSSFIRKNIDELKLHEDFYYDHEIGFALKSDKS